MTDPGVNIGAEESATRLRPLAELLARRLASIQTMITDHELDHVPDHERAHFDAARQEILSGSDELEALVYRLAATKAGIILNGVSGQLSR